MAIEHFRTQHEVQLHPCTADDCDVVFSLEISLQKHQQEQHHQDELQQTANTSEKLPQVKT